MSRSSQLAQLFVVFLPHFMLTDRYKQMQRYAGTVNDYQSTTAVLAFAYSQRELLSISIAFHNEQFDTITWQVGASEVSASIEQLSQIEYNRLDYAVQNELEKFLRRNLGCKVNLKT